MADDVLYQGVKGVTDLMVRPGLINLDFADVRAVMDEMGKAMMGTGEAEGEDRAIQAAEKAIANPLLDEISLRGAKGVLINITGAHDLTLFELDEAANRIREEVDPEANIIVGSTLDTAMEGMMRVSVVATGIDASDVQTDIPVPRRSLSQPLSVPKAAEVAEVAAVEEAPLELADPVETQPAVAAEEPTLFEGMDVEPVAAQDLGEDIFDDQLDDDGLPPPAYQPEAAEFQPQPETPVEDDALAASFVAPKPPAPGTPSPEALERLRAAAQRTQPAPAAPETAAQPEKRGFGINSLINRMTGHAADTPAQPARQQPVVRQQAPQAGVAAQPSEAEEAEQDRIEIPAFLRRQAN